MADPSPKHAVLYHDHSERPGVVVCDLCHHRCTIAPGATGICRARRNEDGTLVSLVYGRAIALNADPIEKKPLFHFLPGTKAMSVATVGCNFHCDFCQNAHISQRLQESSAVPGEWIEPAQIVETTRATRCRSIAFTYTEPTIFFEYALDTARLARRHGIATCFVSNGYMTPEAVDRIGPFLDAINVDLKAFDDTTYRQVIGGRLDAVLETITHLHHRGVWVEITTLLIPGLNDSIAEVRRIASFIASLSVDIPWHVSRFHPQYRMMDRPATPLESIHQALRIGEEAGLRHIYCGNCSDERYESTFCPSCGHKLIERRGYTILDDRLGSGGKCPNCQTPCAGVFDY